MEETTPIVMRNEKMNIGTCQNYYHSLVLWDYQLSNAKIKIHHSSIEQSSLSRNATFEPILGDFMSLVMENHEVENRDLMINNTFGNFGLS